MKKQTATMESFGQQHRYTRARDSFAPLPSQSPAVGGDDFNGRMKHQRDNNSDGDSSTAASSETETEVSFESLLTEEDRRRQQQQQQQKQRNGSRQKEKQHGSRRPQQRGRSRSSCGRSTNSKYNRDPECKNEQRRSHQRGPSRNEQQRTFLKELFGLSIAGAFTGCLLGGQATRQAASRLNGLGIQEAARKSVV